MILEIEKGLETVIIRTTADRCALSEVCGYIDQFMQEFEADLNFAPTIIARELVSNAIQHGSPVGEENQIIVEVKSVGTNSFRITVEDEGRGFDYTNLDTQLTDDPRKIKDRGLSLITALSDRLEFNEKGNRITAFFNVNGV